MEGKQPGVTRTACLTVRTRFRMYISLPADGSLKIITEPRATRSSIRHGHSWYITRDLIDIHHIDLLWVQEFFGIRQVDLIPDKYIEQVRVDMTIFLELAQNEQ